MNDLLEPPGERDLPTDRAERIRAAALDEPAPSHTGRRVAVLAAVVTTVAAGAGGVAVWPSGDDGQGTEVLAMSAAELSPALRKATEQCLSWHRTSALTLDDLAVAVQDGYRSVMLFLNEFGYYTCDVALEPGKEVTGGTDSDLWGGRRDWLPGPVQWLGLASAEDDGGDVMVTGRASARVSRLVLEHGDGRTTTARLKDGAFGLVSRGGRVNVDAELVSYDAAGAELSRMRLLDPDRPDRCYADPDGEVLYPARTAPKDAPRPDPATCLPTEAWR